MPSVSPAPSLESTAERPRKAVASGWASLDRTLFASSFLPSGGDLSRPMSGSNAAPDSPPGLVRGGVHEWFGTGCSGEGRTPGSPTQTPASFGAWAPPLFLLGHLAARAVQEASERGAPTYVLWIGRSVWPYPRTLNGGVELMEVDRRSEAPPGLGASPCGGLLLDFDLELREVPERFSLAGGPLFEHSLFVDPGSGYAQAGQRLWAIDTALRCPSVTAIVADGSGLPMAATRRLQLAAAAGDALVLLARPPVEVGEVSAATTRWAVTRAHGTATEPGTEQQIDGDLPSDAAPPRWRVELLRAKGSQGVR